tara:strand:- start:778 stop:1773 length:996 start_codon:yes stop_codon:yes gene_type:complete
MKRFQNISSHLICPTCKDKLSFNDEKLSFQCSDNHTWEVSYDIPRFINSKENYTTAFGLQWKKYRKTQLDSYTNTRISRKRLMGAIGDIDNVIIQKKQINVLEVGCGAGRFTEILLSFKNINLISMDFSNAVEANLDNHKGHERHTIIQCDINNSPFKTGYFDLVICLGVVQHTLKPETTIKNMYNLVKPGGRLIFDHYAHTFSYYTKLGTICLRPILKRMNADLALKITDKIVNLLFPIHKAVKNIYFLQIILSRISPVRVYFSMFPELNDELQYEWALLDTHDGLTDYYKHFRTQSQLTNTLISLGAKNIIVNKGGNGIECRCQKPKNL